MPVLRVKENGVWTDVVVVPTHVHTTKDIADYPIGIDEDVAALQENKADKTDLHDHSNKTVLDGIQATDVSSWNNKSDFSGDYDDLDGKPNILDDESAEFLIADTAGNIVVRVDNDGVYAVHMSVGDLVLNGQDFFVAVDHAELITPEDIDKICGYVSE